ncbi:CARDB domain-containing protein, partial [Flavobacterium cyanobacteriorum]
MWYRAVVQNGNCAIAATSSFNVSILSLPTANAGPDINILRGSTGTVVATGGTSYQWTVLGSNTVLGTNASLVVGPLNTTTYQVKVTSAEGCTATDTVVVTVDFSGLEIFPSPIVQFGSVPVNTLSVRNLAINNVGSLPFTINSAVITGSSSFTFTGINTPLTLTSTQSYPFSVQFSPVSTTFQSASLTLNTTIGTFVINLSGSGTNQFPAWTINPTAYNFGSVAIGSSVPFTFTVANLGNIPIDVGNIVSNNPGVFSATTSATTIPVGQSINITATFSPNAVGNTNGIFTFNTTTPNLAGLQVNVQGYGFNNAPGPVLSYVTEAPYNGTDGVSPTVGVVTQIYTYKVKYTNSSGVAPAPGFPKVSIDKNGNQVIFGPGEGEYSMNQIGTGTDWVNGETFIFSTSLELGTLYKYKFTVTDVNGNSYSLLNEPTPYKDGPDVYEEGLDLFVYAGDIRPTPTGIPGDLLGVNQNCNIKATIHNGSVFAATSNFKVKLYILNGTTQTLYSTVLVTGGINPLGVREVDFGTFQFPTAGLYTARVVIDEDFELQDYNRINNVANRLIPVDRDVPEILISNLNASLGNSSNNTSTIIITGLASYDTGIATSGAEVQINIQNPFDPSQIYNVIVNTNSSGYFTAVYQLANCWQVQTNCATFPCDTPIPFSLFVTDFVVNSQTVQSSFVKPCLLRQSAYGGFRFFQYACPAQNYPITYTANFYNDAYIDYFDQDNVFVNREHIDMTNVSIKIYLNGVLVDQRNYPSVNHGESFNFSTTIVNNTPAYSNNNFTAVLTYTPSNPGVEVTENYPLPFTTENSLPDLRIYPPIYAYTLPDGRLGIISTGESFTFPYENFSSCVPAGAFKIRVYEYDGTDESTAVFLQEYDVPAGLFAVDPKPSITHTYPNMPLGCRFFLLKIDDPNLIDEYNENNNTASFEFCRVLPDPFINIKALSLNISDINYGAGSTINFSATIVNDSEIDITTPFQVQFYAHTSNTSVPLGPPQIVNSMAINQLLSFNSIDYTCSSECPIYYSFVADLSNVITENIEYDNAISQSVGIDFNAGLGWPSLGSQQNPYLVYPGSTNSFVTQISNNGNKPATNVKYRLRYNDNVIFSNIVPTFQASTGIPITVTQTVSGTGTQVIYVDVDYDDTGGIGDYCEYNENNTGAIYLQFINDVPDLEVISSQIIPEPISVPALGDIVKIKTSIRNNNPVSSGPFNIKISIVNPDGTQNQLGDIISAAGLPPGPVSQDSWLSTVDYTITQNDINQGYILVKVEADINFQVSEAVRSNNVGQRTILLNLPPTAIIDYTDVCETDTVADVTLTTTGDITSSSFSSNSPNLIINPSTGQIDVANSQPGSYIITYTFSNSAYPNLTVTTPFIIYELPVILDQPDQTQCANDTFIMTQNAPAAGTGTWSVVSGSATITNPNDPATSVIVPESGSATLTWTVVNGVCSVSSNPLTLTNNAAPVQPSLACYETATFNTVSCAW